MYMVLLFLNENIFVGFQIFLWGSMYECKMSLCINSNGSTSLKLRQKCSHYEGKEGRKIHLHLLRWEMRESCCQLCLILFSSYPLLNAFRICIMLQPGIVFFQKIEGLFGRTGFRSL